MATLPISSCRFHITPLNERAYQYTTAFLDENGTVLSTKETVFHRRVGPANPGTVVDFYSQNGRSLPNPKDILGDSDGHLFEHHDVKGLNRVVNKLKLNPETDQTVFVLDLQDVNGSYLDPVSISDAEKVVCDWMSSDQWQEKLGKSARKIHSMIRPQILMTQSQEPKIQPPKLPVHHILCEGSLKAQLIKGLSDEQAAYFLQRKREHRDAFCEYTEPFMTAIKLGDQIVDLPYPKTPYLQQVLSRSPLIPLSTSTVFYPEEYQELYSPEARIPKELSKVYPITFAIDTENSITEMVIEGQRT